MTPKAVAVAAAVLLAAPASAPSAAMYKLSAAPVASFIWYPKTPRVGEKVSFVSTSSDLTSPIVKYAWDVSDNGPFGAFVPGGPQTSTSFSTPAPHVVRLRVTNREGLTSVASATIRMSSAGLGLITPFPVVRIVGSRNARGVLLRLLAVRAPRDATIAVTCATSSCPHSLRRVRAKASGRGPGFLSFRRYARRYPAGAKLEIRITKPGFVGAYTAFAVRRHKVPSRVDACLAPAGTKPIACPS